MDQKRRKFLQQMAAVCGANVARSLGMGLSTAVVASVGTQQTAVAATATAVVAGGSIVRQKVFEVIVRQAIMGAPWKEICAGPMQVNSITEKEITDEVARLIALGEVPPPHGERCLCKNCIKERTERHRAALASIPHSPLSPCACENCRIAMDRIMLEIYKSVYPDDARTRTMQFWTYSSNGISCQS